MKLSAREQFLKALIDELHDKIMEIQDEVKKLKPKQIIVKLTELEQRIIKLEKDKVTPKPKVTPKSKATTKPKATK